MLCTVTTSYAGEIAIQWEQVESIETDGPVHVVLTGKNRYTVGAEANQGKEAGTETADNWLLYTNYDHFLTQKWFFYTAANFEQDDFKDLNLRTTVRAGSEYQFFESSISLRSSSSFLICKMAL